MSWPAALRRGQKRGRVATAGPYAAHARTIGVAALAVVGLASVLLAAPARTDLTSASWTDNEFSTTTMTATVIQPPVINSCVFSAGLFGSNPVVTVTWRFLAPSTYAAPGNILYFVASGDTPNERTPVTLGSNLTTSAPVANVYTTQYKSGLFSGFFGSFYVVSLQARDGSGWTSVLASATASDGILGIGSKCDITPPT